MEPREPLVDRAACGRWDVGKTKGLSKTESHRKTYYCLPRDTCCSVISGLRRVVKLPKDGTRAVSCRVLHIRVKNWSLHSPRRRRADGKKKAGWRPRQEA
jgi:hypothetical protein